MKPYEHMKPSTYEWLHTIPSHWQELFLEQVSREKCEKNISNRESNVLSLSYGRIIRKKNVYAGLVAKDFATYQIVRRNDIILRFTDLQNDHTSLRTGLVTETGIITAAYTCIVPTINSAFLHYLLHAYDLRKVFYGMGGGVRQSIGFKDVRHMFVPVPPRAEQDQIVRFLNWKVSEINRAIKLKRREIALLKEQRQRKLTFVVLHGLNQNVQMKETGIRWVGSIPAHWKCVPLKRCATVRSGITLGKKYPANTELIDVPYLRVANVQNGHVNLDTIVSIKVTPKEAKQYQLPVGCVLMTEGGDRDKLGRGCVWNGEIENCIHQNHIFAVTVDEELLCNKWLEYVSASDVGRTYFDVTAIRTTNLACTNASKVLAFPIPLPPREEQESMIREISMMISELIHMESNIEKQISSLEELKAKLISDVVTGKIDVRGIEIPEYEPVIEESDPADEDSAEEEPTEDQED